MKITTNYKKESILYNQAFRWKMICSNKDDSKVKLKIFVIKHNKQKWSENAFSQTGGIRMLFKENVYRLNIGTKSRIRLGWPKLSIHH